MSETAKVTRGEGPPSGFQAATTGQGVVSGDKKAPGCWANPALQLMAERG